MPASSPKNPASPILYHGTARPITRARLTPHFTYAINGQYGKFVFATINPDIAYCYALKDQRMLSIGLLPDEKLTPYCVIFNRASFLADKLSGRIYEFTDPHFKPVLRRNRPTGEFVRTRPVSLARAQSYPVPGLHTLLDRGIQVLFTAPDVTKENFLDRFFEGHTIPELTRQGLLESENHRRQINPTPVLALS